MNNENTRRLIFFRVLFGIVLIAITVIAILQYRIAGNAAAVKMDEVYTQHYYTIKRSIDQETEGFYYLSKIDFDESKSELTETEIIQSYLSKLITRYNYSDAEYMQNYILSTGYSIYPELTPFYELQDAENSNWLEEEIDLIIEPSEASKLYRVPGMQQLESNSNIYLIYQIIGKDPQYLIYFKIDLDKFYRYLLIPSLKRIYADKQIYLYENEAILNSEKIKTSYFYSKEYKFSPLKLLLTSREKEDMFWVIPLMSQILRYTDKKLNIPDENIEENKLLFLIDLQSEGISIIKNTEYDLAGKWFLEFLLLIGIGATFLILLFQISVLYRQKNREKEFVAGVTHELRTPLTIIQSAADNLHKGVVPTERLSKYGLYISTQTKRLSSMIEEMLHYSSLEGNSIKPAPAGDVDFAEQIKWFLSNIEPLNEGKLQVKYNFDSLPDKAVFDSDSFHIILGNLIKNAMYHAYPQEGKGSIRVTGWLRLPKTLVFTVEDDGIGVSPSDIRQLFKPFYRSRQSRKRQIKGSGLGLFIALKKAKQLNGSLRIESPYQRSDWKKKSGCRFTLKFPYIPIKENEKNEKNTDN